MSGQHGLVPPVYLDFAVQTLHGLDLSSYKMESVINVTEQSIVPVYEGAAAKVELEVSLWLFIIII